MFHLSYRCRTTLLLILVTNYLQSVGTPAKNILTSQFTHSSANMNTTSAIVSEGVLWATTPLFAAAHLWSWHPVWAAGIWTAYGISALFPQGEALLRNMAHSPLHCNFNPVHSPTFEHESVSREIPAHSGKDQVSSVLSTPTLPTNKFEITTQSAQQNTPTPTLPTNKFEITSQSAQQSNPTLILPINATSIFTQPTPVRSELTLFKHPTAGPTADLTGFEWLRHQRVDLWEMPLEVVIWGRKVPLWLAGGVSLLVSGFIQACMWIIKCWVNREAAEVAPAPIAPASNTPTPNASFPGTTRFEAFTVWRDVIPERLQQWGQELARYWRSFTIALVISRRRLDVRAQILVWSGDHQKHVQVARVLLILITCMIGIGYLLMHFPKWVWPAITFATGHASIASSKTTLLNCSRQITACTKSAFRTRLSPDSSYKPLPSPSSRTEIACGWVLHLVMIYKSALLMLSNSPLGTIKRCHDASWTNPMPLSGLYHPAFEFGRMASLCTTIEQVVLSGRHINQLSAPYYVSATAVQISMRRLIVKVLAAISPILSMSLALFMLNILAFVGWPSSDTKSTRSRAERIVAAFSLLVLAALASFIIEEYEWLATAWVAVDSTSIALIYFKGCVEPIWNRILQLWELALTLYRGKALTMTADTATGTPNLHDYPVDTCTSEAVGSS